jgi:hypothetical protein
MSSKKRGTPEGFPEIPGEKLFDRRIRLSIWKERNGIKSANLRTNRTRSLGSLSKEVMRLWKELEAIRAKLEGGGK